MCLPLILNSNSPITLNVYMDLISNDLFFIKNEQCRASKMTQKVKELGEET